ncbi:MAG: hypothetical protein IKA14_03515, partial [Bacteroidales bacterium]|nr:hypothetical protein [Bacteroidales bacterium]
LQQSLLPKRYPIRGQKHPPAVNPPQKIPHSWTEASSSSHSSPKDTPFGTEASSSSHSSPKDTPFVDRSNSQAPYMTFN